MESANEAASNTIGGTHVEILNDKHGLFVRKTIKFDHKRDLEVRRYAERECYILKSLIHRNIAKFRDFRIGVDVTFIDMDYYEGGTLVGLIQRRMNAQSFLSESYIWTIFYQLSAALIYCHEGLIDDPWIGEDGEIDLGNSSRSHVTILHRDIKPSNVFLESSSERRVDSIKLGDFGLSTTLDGNPTTYVGTTRYLPPEITRTKVHQQWTVACDIFSLGCTIYEIAALRPTFEDHVEDRSEIPSVSDLPRQYSISLRSLIVSCLTFDLSSRPTSGHLTRATRKQIRAIPSNRQVILDHNFSKSVNVGDFKQALALTRAGANHKTPCFISAQATDHMPPALGDQGQAAPFSRQADPRFFSDGGISMFQEIPHVLLTCDDVTGSNHCTSTEVPYLAIHRAALMDNDAYVDEWAAYGHDIDSLTLGSEHETAAHLAASHGCVKTLSKLIQLGADPHKADHRGQTLIHRAVRAGNFSCIELLISSETIQERERDHISRAYWANSGSILQNSAPDFTPLHLAALRRTTAIVELLLDAGADMSAVVNRFYTPLHLAALSGHVSIVSLFLSRGANLGENSRYALSPLCLAVCRGSADVVERLLAVGASTNAFYNEESLVFSASRCSHGDPAKVIRLLSDQGINIKERAERYSVMHDGKLNDNMTPLHCAAAAGNIHAVSQLVSLGENPSVLSEQGFTPLHFGVRCGHIEVLQDLLKCGATLDLQAVEIAALHGKTELLRFLREKGAPFARQRRLKAPKSMVLSNAVQSGSLDAVTEVLKYGSPVDINKGDSEGCGALVYVARYLDGHENRRLIFKALIKAGAEVEKVRGFMEREKKELKDERYYMERNMGRRTPTSDQKASKTFEDFVPVPSNSRA